MPDSWNATVYRQRAEAWRQRAALVEDEAQRNTCLGLAEGYGRLAGLIEAEARQLQRSQDNSEGPRPGPKA
jgi:hypothetical protein